MPCMERAAGAAINLTSLGHRLEDACTIDAYLAMIDVQPVFRPLIFGDRADALAQVLWTLIVIAAAILPFISVVAMLGIWWERKVSAHIQSRIGPNRVGPIGLIQSLADGLKLISKEDLCPRDADRLLFKLAPYIVFAPVFAAFVAIPFAPHMTVEPRLSAGLFWVLALLGVEVIGVILAGWASNNKWSVYGAMREACQMVSYEIPLGISILVGVMAAGTLNLVNISFLQSGGIHTWIIFANPFALCAFFTYFIASLAANKRAPFDLPESESELVAGYHTEYSGMRFAMFFFAEYAAMFVVAAVQTALFLGGWNDPFGLIGKWYASASAAGDQTQLILLNFVGAGIFVAKTVVLIYVQMWLRWTLPRPRIDQVLYVCVKVLLPLSGVLLLGSALWQLFIYDPVAIPWRDFHPWRFADWNARQSGVAYFARIGLALIGVAGLSAVAIWILYAMATAGTVRKRLSMTGLSKGARR